MWSRSRQWREFCPRETAADTFTANWSIFFDDLRVTDAQEVYIPIHPSKGTTTSHPCCCLLASVVGITEIKEMKLLKTEQINVAAYH